MIPVRVEILRYRLEMTLVSVFYIVWSILRIFVTSISPLSLTLSPATPQQVRIARTDFLGASVTPLDMILDERTLRCDMAVRQAQSTVPACIYD